MFNAGETFYFNCKDKNFITFLFLVQLSSINFNLKIVQ